jgi:hypothetical protein
MARGFERANMQEGVARAVRELDEAEALLGIEPLHDGVHDRAEARQGSAGCEGRLHLIPAAVAASTGAATARLEIVIEAAPARLAIIASAHTRSRLDVSKSPMSAESAANTSRPEGESRVFLRPRGKDECRAGPERPERRAPAVARRRIRCGPSARPALRRLILMRRAPFVLCESVQAA